MGPATPGVAAGSAFSGKPQKACLFVLLCGWGFGLVACVVISVWFFVEIAYLNCFFELGIALSNQIAVNSCAFCSETVLVPLQKCWIQHRGSNKGPKAM